MLPKHWGEPVGGGEVAEQLAAKTISHNSLLHILSAAGILQQLPSPVLRCLLHLPEILASSKPRHSARGVVRYYRTASSVAVAVAAILTW